MCLAFVLSAGMTCEASELSSDETIWRQTQDIVTAAEDTYILDYPARKEGEQVGELREGETLSRTGVVGDYWSQVLYTDDSGAEQIGYVLTSELTCSENQGEIIQNSNTDAAAGMLSKGSGSGVFAEAAEEGNVAEITQNQQGVYVGTPQVASADASLTYMGVFRITHYCDCPKCCGPYSGGPTASGTMPTTNRTIAVDPSQIPYGTKVVINGQVYVAEDCGGAIKTNCIDIYVATCEEGDALGMYYTDVYVMN